MISLSSTLEREFDDYVTVRLLNQCYLYLAPKLKVITYFISYYHFIRYRSLGVFNLVEIRNTFVDSQS